MAIKECKICSQRATKLRDEQFNIDYYFCNYCKFIFIDAVHIVDPEEEVAVYQQHNNTMENERYVNMFEDFIKKGIDPYLSQTGKALDFGCGPGPVLATLLKRKGFDVDIYDPYFAPQKIYLNKEYDLITATEVFEHLRYPYEATTLLTEHLKDGGILAIMTLFHPGGDAKAFNNWWYRRDPTHISFYTLETFKVLASLLGLEVLFYDEKNICILTKGGN